MRKIIISNEILTKDTYNTNLSSDYSSGTSLTVISNVSFAANDLIVVGELGEENTELKKVDSISGKTTITLASALNFSHEKDTPVYKVAWDNVSIERNSVEITQSAIQWDKKDTIYYDSSGTASDSYRFRFYNSVTTTYSEYSPTQTGAGPTRPSLGYMIREIRKLAQDIDRKIVTDLEIARFINSAQDIIAGIRSDWWFLKVEDTSKTTTGGTKKYSLPSGVGNMGAVEAIRLNYNDGTNNELYHLEYKPTVEFDELIRDNRNQEADRDDYTIYYTLREPDSSAAQGYFEVWPVPLTTGRGTFYIRYFKEMTDLDDVSDETSIPIPVILEDYALAQIERIKGNETKAELYERKFFGPPQGLKESRQISGISLLERLNNAQKRPTGQPRQLIRFGGQRVIARLYGNRSSTFNRDKQHTDYW